MNATHLTARMLEALEIVRRIEPCTAHQLAEHLDVGMATARTHLQNLRVLGYVKADGGNRWAKWVSRRVESDLPEIVQVSSVWEYAARCQQERRA